MRCQFNSIPSLAFRALVNRPTTFNIILFYRYLRFRDANTPVYYLLPDILLDIAIWNPIWYDDELHLLRHACLRPQGVILDLSVKFCWIPFVEVLDLMIVLFAIMFNSDP